MSKSTPMRPQPPSIEDPEQGSFNAWDIGREDEDRIEVDGEDVEEEQSQPNWVKRGKDAFRFSTSYVDSNYRKQWEDSIRAFNNQHASDSKYNSEAFRKRSSIYRPKTRTVIRKNEAAAAAAFFSNIDRISVSPMNPSVKEEVIGAEIMQQLIQYRLTKSVPWFQIVLGGIQDAQVQGAVAAHVYWRYTTKKKGNELVPVEDMPCVDLIPLENIRVDPACSWLDPIGSSPYIIHLIPMYVGDVKQKMKYPDPKGRRWKELPETAFLNAEAPDDSTRQVRIGLNQDPTQQKREVSDYDICWVHRHIHRWNGTDYEFYMLDSQHMLSDPEPLEDSVFHGRRPYVMGVAILETHKPLPSSLPKLTDGLQSEANEIANQRLDNVKFVLNKAWKAKRGKNVDLASLVRNVPGRVMMMDNLEDVEEVNWPDVTGSSYQEQDRINVDFDELAGNFSPAAMRQNRMARESEGSMLQLQAPSNLLTEYLLKTYTETFVQPVLRQLVLLEQHYETDKVILGIAGQKAQVFQKFGINEVTDELLDRELTTVVNVGMGATDPNTRIQRFAFALQTYQRVALKPPPGLNMGEVWKEISALSGYQDGERFTLGQEPALLQLQQQNKQLMQVLQQLKMKLNDRHEANVVKLETAKLNNQTKLITKAMEEHNENRQLLAGHYMKMEQDTLNPPNPVLDAGTQ